jgi:hypothetical protein
MGCGCIAEWMIVARFFDLHKKKGARNRQPEPQPKQAKKRVSTTFEKPKNLFMRYVMKYNTSCTSMVFPALTARPRPIERTKSEHRSI